MDKCKSILLVDDDDISNFINQRVISSANITDHIFITKNGLEALKYLRSQASESNGLIPDVILLDVKMPVMDGFEFLEEFEMTEKHLVGKIKIILLTSSNNPSDIEQAKKYNISGYINKPLTSDKLNEVFAQITT
jgi:CheY-like chemotaxis protein